MRIDEFPPVEKGHDCQSCREGQAVRKAIESRDPVMLSKLLEHFYECYFMAQDDAAFARGKREGMFADALMEVRP